jgi:hypothetical protein
LRAGQNDVPAVAERVFRRREVVVVLGDEPLTRPGIEDRLEDRIERKQRVPWEVHLRDDPLGEGRAEHREVDVRRPPGVRVIAPGIRAGLDRLEAVETVVVSDAAARAGEVGVERRRMLVPLVDVTARGVRLPHLDELMPHRAPLAIEHLPGDDHSRAERLTPMLDGEVRLDLRDIPVPERGRPQFDGLGVDVVQVLGRMPQQAAPVGREVEFDTLGSRRPGRDRVLVLLLPRGDLVRDLGLAGRCRHGVRGRTCACSCRVCTCWIRAHLTSVPAFVLTT